MLKPRGICYFIKSYSVFYLVSFTLKLPLWRFHHIDLHLQAEISDVPECSTRFEWNSNIMQRHKSHWLSQINVKAHRGQTRLGFKYKQRINKKCWTLNWQWVKKLPGWFLFLPEEESGFLPSYWLTCTKQQQHDFMWGQKKGETTGVWSGCSR